MHLAESLPALVLEGEVVAARMRRPQLLAGRRPENAIVEPEPEAALRTARRNQEPLMTQ